MKVVLFGGAGGVGSSVAFNLLIGPTEHEIVLVDPRAATSESHAMDLEQVLGLGGVGTVRVGAETDVTDADLVVVTCSAPLRPNASRLEFLEENAPLVGGVADTIASQPSWGGVVLMVTNPLDPLVMLCQERSGLDRGRVLGYSLNDSLRLRSAISRALGCAPASVDAWVLGEHGDASVPLFSCVRVAGEPVVLDARAREEATSFLRGWYRRHVALDPTRSSTWTSGRGIARMIAAITQDERVLLPAAVVLEGEYGLHEVSLGVPAVIGAAGAQRVEEWDLADEERDGMEHAAHSVRAAAAAIAGG